MSIAVITEDYMRQIAAQIVGTYVDVDGGFGNQCWDSQAFINSHFFGLPIISTGGAGRWPGWAGNMVDAYPQTPEIAAAYELVSPDQPGVPGDTYVWGDSNRVWYPSTHVATLVVDSGNGWPLFLSQNSSMARPDLPGYSTYSTGPVIYQNLPTEGLIGILRPRTSGIGSLDYAGDIINQLQEAGVALDLSDRQFIQQVVNEANTTAVNEIRAQSAYWAGELAQKVADNAYQVKVFTQTVNNQNSDRVILDNRAQTAELAAAVASSKAATGASAEEIKQAVEDALAKGINVNVTVGEQSNG